MEVIPCMECKNARFFKGASSQRDGIGCTRLERWEPLPEYLEDWEAELCKGSLPFGCVFGEKTK